MSSNIWLIHGCGFISPQGGLKSVRGLVWRAMTLAQNYIAARKVTIAQQHYREIYYFVYEIYTKGV